MKAYSSTELKTKLENLDEMIMSLEKTEKIIFNIRLKFIDEKKEIE